MDVVNFTSIAAIIFVQLERGFAKMPAGTSRFSSLASRRARLKLETRNSRANCLGWTRYLVRCIFTSARGPRNMEAINPCLAGTPHNFVPHYR